MSSPSQAPALPFPLSWSSAGFHAGTAVTPAQLSDEQIVACLQAGDASTLFVLFDRYSRLVLDIALHVFHDRGEAEEIVQEVFFYIYRKASLFDPAKGLAKAWIIQLAYHRSLDRRSYLGRRGFYAGTEIDSLDDTLSAVTDLEREVGARFDQTQLEKAFKQLPETQRRTLEFYYFDGLNLREIGEQLNQPLGNVRHHYYRGLERLRKSALVRKLREK